MNWPDVYRGLRKLSLRGAITDARIFTVRFVEAKDGRPAYEQTPMRAISNRVRKLEDRFVLSVATEADLRLWEKIEAGRRRRAERTGETFVPRPYGSPLPDEIREFSIVEILHRGRERARAACR